MSFAAYVFNPSPTKIINLDDLPTPVSVAPQTGAALTGATLTDVQNSLLLRHFDLYGDLEVYINKKRVKLSELGLLVGA